MNHGISIATIMMANEGELSGDRQNLADENNAE
jgi:hypothetical protein